jgi:hypothetical protein
MRRRPRYGSRGGGRAIALPFFRCGDAAARAPKERKLQKAEPCSENARPASPRLRRASFAANVRPARQNPHPCLDGRAIRSSAGAKDGGEGGIRTHGEGGASDEAAGESESDPDRPSQPASQKAGDHRAELTEIVAAWPTLAASVRLALLTLVRVAGSGAKRAPVSRDTEVPGVALGSFYGREPTVRDVPPEGEGPPRLGGLPTPSKAERPAKGGESG